VPSLLATSDIDVPAPGSASGRESLLKSKASMLLESAFVRSNRMRRVGSRRTATIRSARYKVSGSGENFRRLGDQ
jgi:hypothetical protein